MNGDEIDRIAETFRYELGLAIEPLSKSMDNLGKVLVDHGEDIVENKTEIGYLKNGFKRVSGRVWAVILGVPTLLLVIVAFLVYLTG